MLGRLPRCRGRIDVLSIGPFDLGVNIGHPMFGSGVDPELVNAIQTIHEAAQAASKVTSIYCDTSEQAREYAKQGFQMMSAMTDMVGLGQVFKQAFEKTASDVDIRSLLILLIWTTAVARIHLANNSLRPTGDLIRCPLRTET